MAETFKLAEAVHVEGHAPGSGERYSFDFKAGTHKPKNELEEFALAQAVSAQAHAAEVAKVQPEVEPGAEAAEAASVEDE